MDEQDQEWLDALNHDRRNQGLDSISYDVFEIILDQLEKEWFDLMKRVPPKARHGAGADAAGDGADADDAHSDDGEDSKCAICDDGECENSNAIVFCDGCNLAVHQDCYGIPYIPEGQWLCRKCTVSPDRAVSCILCPHEGGAFKQTTTGKWAHLLCAMWIPETGVSNPVYMEPIDSVERIPKPGGSFSAISADTEWVPASSATEAPASLPSMSPAPAKQASSSAQNAPASPITSTKIQTAVTMRPRGAARLLS